MAYIASIPIPLISQVVPLRCKGRGKLLLGNCWGGVNEAVRGTYSSVCRSMLPLGFVFCWFPKVRSSFLGFGVAASHHLKNHFVPSSHKQYGDRFWEKTCWGDFRRAWDFLPWQWDIPSEHFGLGVISAPKMNAQKIVSCLSHVQAASGKIAFLRWKHPECPGFVTEKENSFYRLPGMDQGGWHQGCRLDEVSPQC